MERESIGTHTVRRATLLFSIVGFVFLMLLLRIVLLQTVGFERYREKVLEQSTTETPLPAVRGTIYDRNGQVLATNITTYRVFISPNGILRGQKAMDSALEEKEIKQSDPVKPMVCAARLPFG